METTVLHRIGYFADIIPSLNAASITFPTSSTCRKRMLWTLGNDRAGSSVRSGAPVVRASFSSS